MLMTLPALFALWMGPLTFEHRQTQQFAREGFVVVNTDGVNSRYVIEAYKINGSKITIEKEDRVKLSHSSVWIPKERRRKLFFSYKPSEFSKGSSFAVCSYREDYSSPVRLRVCSAIRVQ